MSMGAAPMRRTPPVGRVSLKEGGGEKIKTALGARGKPPRDGQSFESPRSRDSIRSPLSTESS